ncbi:baseplate J/gp47 family protein [Haemophilus parahaemolyticus]
MFIVPTLPDIRAVILRDYQSLNPQADISVDSDHYARASVLAAVAEGIYAHQKWIVKQIFPDTADTEFLEKHASLRGIIRRNATYASGLGVTVYGNDGAVIEAGKQIKTEDDRFYEVIEQGVIAGGVAQLRVRSLAMGTDQNIREATAGLFMSAPAGVRSECVLNNVQGGTDSESDASLLERLLEHIRRPPAGGNRYDYKNWALNVDGVDSAYIYPLRRGLGTVDIVITSNNDLPSDETVAKVQAYIDDVRPVTAKEVKVMKPDVTVVNFNIAVSLVNVSLAEMTAEIRQALSEYFKNLPPASDLVISQCEAIVSDLIDVVDRRFVQPSANLKANITEKIEWFRLGTVTVTEMR